MIFPYYACVELLLLLWRKMERTRVVNVYRRSDNSGIVVRSLQRLQYSYAAYGFSCISRTPVDDRRTVRQETTLCTIPHPKLVLKRGESDSEDGRPQTVDG